MAGQNKNLAGPDAMTLEECGPYGCGYHKFAVFQFLVVICVTYWLFTMLWMGMYLIQKVPPAGTEFMIYAVFNVLILIAFSTSWTECNETIVDPTYPVCKRATGAKASIAFAMFTWLALCVSMMFTWKEWRVCWRRHQLRPGRLGRRLRMRRRRHHLKRRRITRQATMPLC